MIEIKHVSKDGRTARIEILEASPAHRRVVIHRFEGAVGPIPICQAAPFQSLGYFKDAYGCPYNTSEPEIDAIAAELRAFFWPST